MYIYIYVSYQPLIHSCWLGGSLGIRLPFAHNVSPLDMLACPGKCSEVTVRYEIYIFSFQENMQGDIAVHGCSWPKICQFIQTLLISISRDPIVWKAYLMNPYNLLWLVGSLHLYDLLLSFWGALPWGLKTGTAAAASCCAASLQFADLVVPSVGSMEYSEFARRCIFEILEVGLLRDG